MKPEQSGKGRKTGSDIWETQTNPPITRSSGVTESERQLAFLAERSFLNLWSYPNTYIDKKLRGKGDGKELCDLLVVCGDHVLIFSDKTVDWPNTGDLTVSWNRWYKRAISKSVNQVRGAERWIDQFPERIYLDKQCSQRLPLNLPPPERRRVHGIVVARGSGNAAKTHFGGGTGSLFIAPHIQGKAHFSGSDPSPFMVGDADPTGSFIHILDDATLEVVLRELDTITDFTAYLSKKERLIRAGKLTAAAGEEELVAYYLTHMNNSDEHDFANPDGSDLKENQFLGIDEGLYQGLTTNEQYFAKKNADKVSYVWDELIELFTRNLLKGTTIVPEGETFELNDHEQGVRHMALVPRYQRRVFGKGIMDALSVGTKEHRFTRAFVPSPAEKDRSVGFFFMTLAMPQGKLEGGYSQYRNTRLAMLKVYALACFERYPFLQRVVGIGCEPANLKSEHKSSEDLVFAQRPEWTEEVQAYLDEGKRDFNIMNPSNYTETHHEDKEYPEINNLKTTGLNRSERRKMASLNRRKAKRRRK